MKNVVCRSANVRGLNDGSIVVDEGWHIVRKLLVENCRVLAEIADTKHNRLPIVNAVEERATIVRRGRYVKGTAKEIVLICHRR